MVPSSKEYGRLYDSETGEMVEESINLRVGEKTVLDFGFLDQYRGWNMDYTTIKSAVENTELGSGIIKVTPDYANKTVTIEALKEGTSGVLVNWNYKNAGGNSVDGAIGAGVNVYDTQEFNLKLQTSSGIPVLAYNMTITDDNKTNLVSNVVTSDIRSDINFMNKELEEYMNELSRDIIEMISDATPDQKVLLAQKLNTLASKVQ